MRRVVAISEWATALSGRLLFPQWSASSKEVGRGGADVSEVLASPGRGGVFAKGTAAIPEIGDAIARGGSPVLSRWPGRTHLVLALVI